MRQARRRVFYAILTLSLLSTITIFIYFNTGFSPATLNDKLQKNFHFIWISPTLDNTNVFSIESKFLNNINSCRKLHPNWKFIIWTDETVKSEFPELIEFLIKVKTPAVISDILRIYILVRFGGVYLDTDVTCIQKLDSLLKRQYCTAFVGNEESNEDNGAIHRITNALVASTANHPVLIKASEELLLTALGNISPDIKTGRVFLANIINKYNTSENCVYVYRKRVFYPCAFLEREECNAIFEDSIGDPEVYMFHWWTGSWLTEWDTIMKQPSV